jgi:uncharacterized membrane protein
LARIEKSLEINVPPEKIWPLVTWDRVPEYYDSIKKVERTSKDKYKVGSTAHVTGEIAGLKGVYDAEITEIIENKKASWRTISGDITMIYSLTIDPTKVGSRITIAVDYELPYSFLGKLIDKMRVHKELEKDAEKALQKIKDTVEK